MVIRAGLLLPRLADCLGWECASSELLLLTASCITHVSAGSVHEVEAVVASGALPHLIRLLECQHHDDDVCAQALWALANLLAVGPQQLRSRLIHQLGLLQPLHRLVLRPAAPAVVMRPAARALAGVCRPPWDPPLAEPSLRDEVLPCLRLLMRLHDPQAVLDAVWAVFWLVRGHSEAFGLPDEHQRSAMRLVLEQGLLQDLLTLLEQDDHAIAHRALSAVSSLSTGSEQYMQMVLESGVLQLLPRLMERDADGAISSAVLRLMYNITAGTQPQLQILIDTGLLPILVGALTSADAQTSYEASWAMLNLTSWGAPRQLRAAVEAGAVGALRNSLSVVPADAHDQVRESLDRLLFVCSGGAGDSPSGPAAVRLIQDQPPQQP